MKKSLIKPLIGLTALAVLGLGLTGCSKYTGQQTDCTVMGKYISYGDKSSQKRVETTCGVFQVEDDPFRGHFNSADIYAGLQLNHVYNFNAFGYRQPFLSMFPNIESFQEITQ